MNTNRRPDWLVELKNSSNRDCDTKDGVLVNDDEGDVYVPNFPAVLFDLSTTKFTMVMPRAGQQQLLHILKVYIRELSCVPLQPFAMTRISPNLSFAIIVKEGMLPVRVEGFLNNVK